MKIMTTNHKKQDWISKSLYWLRENKWWIVIASLFFVLFFCVMPLFLTFLLDHNQYIGSDIVETPQNGTAGSNPMEKFGLYGDSYGIWNAFFSALAFGGVVFTLLRQNKETAKRTLIEQYYKMLDFQQTLIDDMAVPSVSKTPVNTAVIKNKTAAELKVMEGQVIVKGRKSFLEYKAQLKYLMKAVKDVSIEKELNLSETDVVDIAYALFYFGAEKDGTDILEYLKDYEQKELLANEIYAKIAKDKKHELRRSNQNYMSVYSRNIYNAIKLIDQSELLTKEEKVGFVKVLRAQLSNAELYVLFFNVLSRFGKKWIANKYVVKYQLIQNLPTSYCDGYKPKEYFPEIKFEDEELGLSAFKNIIVERGNNVLTVGNEGGRD